MFPDMIFVKNTDKKMFDFREKTNGLTPLKKCPFFGPC